MELCPLFIWETKVWIILTVLRLKQDSDKNYSGQMCVVPTGVGYLQNKGFNLCTFSPAVFTQ